MKDLTLVVLGNNQDFREDNKIELIYSSGENIKQLIENAKGKYITFIREEDKISKDYLEKIINKCKNDFDYCFINYDVLFDYKNKVKISTNASELSQIKPLYGEYIWSFIFKREKLINLLNINTKKDFNEYVNKEFIKRDAIGELIYFHNPKGKKLIKDIQYTDIKRNEYYKNIIYTGDGCRGLFNGYISWINNIGRCFKGKYDITILYDEIHPNILKTFSKYFRCVKRYEDTNYVCDSLSVTYSTYYYPKNIFTLDQNYLFIHGNMSDYEHARVFHDDIFSHYVAVSKIAAKKAIGYFPTTNIETIMNPFKLDKELEQPHLTLTSAFRYCEVKRPDRVEMIAKILDDLKIPYTWNVFTDQKENTNCEGLIYRKRVENPIPYIADSDYFVLLSDSEAMPYCILEALSVNTKIVVTPLEAYDELKIKNKENAIVIPFDYFQEGSKDKLVEVIKKMYKEKDKKIKYKLDESLWEGYNDVFVK